MEFTQRAVYQQTVTADVIGEVEVPMAGPATTTVAGSVRGSDVQDSLRQRESGAAVASERREVKPRPATLGRTAGPPPPGIPYYNPLAASEDALEPELGRVTREFCLSSLVETQQTKLARKRELQAFREQQLETRVVKVRDALDEEKEEEGNAKRKYQARENSLITNSLFMVNADTESQPTPSQTVIAIQANGQNNPTTSPEGQSAAPGQTATSQSNAGRGGAAELDRPLLQGYESETSSSDYNCSSSEG